MRWGRSKHSMLLLAGSNVHVFLWAPQLGATSYGVTVRHRDGDDWQHYRLMFLEHGRRPDSRQRGRHSDRGGQRFMARPTLIFAELSRWRTTGGTQVRVGLKSYIRVKIGPGGRQL